MPASEESSQAMSIPVHCTRFLMYLCADTSGREEQSWGGPKSQKLLPSAITCMHSVPYNRTHHMLLSHHFTEQARKEATFHLTQLHLQDPQVFWKQSPYKIISSAVQSGLPLGKG